MTESLVILRTERKSSRATMMIFYSTGDYDVIRQDEIDCRLKILADGYRLKSVVKDNEVCEYWIKEDGE